MRAAAFAILVLALATPLPAGGVASSPLVWIDPGHGGSRHGAVSEGGETEKEIALAVAKMLRDELEARGVRVRLSREGDEDVPLLERIRAANEAEAAIFLSIHLNALPPGRARARTRGVETYFLSPEATGARAQQVAARENEEGEAEEAKAGGLSFILDDLARAQAHQDASKLAYAVHQRLVRDVRAPDRGVQQAPFRVLTGARMPAVLVEIGFLSHPVEARRLASEAYQRRVARALARGIEEFFAQLRPRSQGEAPAG